MENIRGTGLAIHSSDSVPVRKGTDPALERWGRRLPEDSDKTHPLTDPAMRCKMKRKWESSSSLSRESKDAKRLE